jgi:hypothetical protein
LIEVVNLEGVGAPGRIEAHGGDGAYIWSGSGGRVAIFYQQAENLDDMKITARGGKTTYSRTIYRGSAGTVFIQQSGQDGSLKLSNVDETGTYYQSDHGTGLEILGRHQIQSVAPGSDPNQWVLTLSSGSLLEHRNYVGYLVDVNAADETGPYYSIKSADWTDQTLTIVSEDDLSSVGANEVNAVHQLTAIETSGNGESWDAGQDRVILTAP